MRKLTEEERLIRKEQIKEYNREYYRKRVAVDPEFAARKKRINAANREKKKNELEELRRKLAAYEENNS